ncbi:hypothetical protein K8I61_06515 [bacterium]|nr:hypothetical protein [bacterium]
MLRSHRERRVFPVRFGLVILAVAALSALAPATAAAQSLQTRTLYVIGDINASFSFPLSAFTVLPPGNAFALDETWNPINRDGGPVGLAVDPYVKRLFVSYEFSGAVDLFDATDASPLGTVALSGSPPPDDLAGMDVLEDLGHLFVIDRRENDVWVFDTTNFTELDKWVLPTGDGAWGIDVVADVAGVDTLFVSDATPTVRWYDVANHTEIGSATFLQGVCVGLAVFMDGDDPVLFCTSVSGAHEPPDSPYLHYLHTGTATENFHFLGSSVTGRGVAVNQNDNTVYVVVDAGSGFSAKPTIRAVDVTTLQETGRVAFGQSGWSPTDLDSTWLAFGGSIDKSSTSHPNGQIDLSDEVVFEIEITNQSSEPIHILPVTDEYDPAQLTYLFSVPPSDDNVDDGQIDWSDLIAQIGADLDFGESAIIEAHFLAQPDICETTVKGQNLARMHDAEFDNGQPVEDAESVFKFTIHCICLTDQECDDGVYCNGPESCTDGACVSAGNPCPMDDGLFCNGAETIICIEDLEECGHTGNPCVDDNNWCNGETTCDEGVDQCVSDDEDPCPDDGLFCNGDEFCTPNQLECQHAGNPCDENEVCEEDTDACIAIEEQDDDDTEPEPEPDDGLSADEPEFSITGGACGK